MEVEELQFAILTFPPDSLSTLKLDHQRKLQRPLH